MNATVYPPFDIGESIGCELQGSRPAIQIFHGPGATLVALLSPASFARWRHPPFAAFQNESGSTHENESTLM